MNDESSISRVSTHESDGVASAGAQLDRAAGCVILLHGRGASAGSILSIARALDRPDIAYLAPQAPGHSWYPRSFLAPLSDNEPWLGAALERVGALLNQVEAVGIPSSRTVVLGFSQGACLALEFTARNARRYGGVVALSGGLIGTGEMAGAPTPMGKRFEYTGTFGGTPIFLGCGDPDAHIPLERVHESSRVLRALGAEVTETIYPGAPHSVNEDEIHVVREMLAELTG